MAATVTSKRLTKGELVNKVIVYITDGKLDDYLERIMEACNTRRQMVRERKLWENVDKLGKPGTRVRLANVRPKYLIGVEGTVVDRPAGFKPSNKPGVIYVDTGTMLGQRERFGPVIGVPASCLEEA